MYLDKRQENREKGSEDTLEIYKVKRSIYCAIARKGWETSGLEPRHKYSEIQERQLALGMQNSLMVIEAMNPFSLSF